MKKHIATFLLSLMLVSQGLAFGQTAAGNPPSAVTGAKAARPLRFYKSPQFWESSAQYWGGVTFDYATSRGGREGNPAVRNDKGQISAGKFFALNGGVYALTIFLPGKLGHWTRRVIGWTHFTVGGYNLSR